MTPFRVVILMPVFQDWECASLLCGSLDEQLRRLSDVDLRVLLVDDGSPNGTDFAPPHACRNLGQIDALRLRRNLGHQRAICIGLCYIHDHFSCDAVLVMDADGEDRPEDAARLIELAQPDRGHVIFAERRKRQEGVVFRSGYHLFRLAHRLLTGIAVRVGNFSIVPFPVVRRLTSMPELWNHFAGAVYKSKMGFECIPMDRGRRMRGQSHMNLAALVMHGIAGIATFGEVVATRILISNAIILVLLLAALAAMVVMGWSTFAIGLVLVLAVQIAALSVGLVFTLMSSRTQSLFVPGRDYTVFVDKIESLPGLE